MKTQTQPDARPGDSAALAIMMPVFHFPKMEPALSDAEADKLEKYEREFEGLQEGFERAAEILLAIRDEQLWRQDYSSFEDYCRKRWDMGARRGRQLANYASTKKTLAGSAHLEEAPGRRNDFKGKEGPVVKDTGTMVTGPEHAAAETGTMVPLPTSERQTRSIGGLPAEKQREIWSEAVKDAGGKVPTGKQVIAAKERVLPARGNGKKQKFSEVQLDAWIDTVRTWLKPGDEVSIAKLMGNKRNSFNTDQMCALFDEMVDRGLVKNQKYVGTGEETEPSVLKLARKIYAIASKEAGIDRKWEQQTENSQRFVIAIARWHLGEIFSLASVVDEEANLRSEKARRDAQSKHDKAVAAKQRYVICREPMKGSIIKAPRYGPGWGLDPDKAKIYESKAAATEAAKHPGDKVMPLEKAQRRFKNRLR